MNDNFIFLFDLDATITKKEILPELAKEVGLYHEMRTLTENAMTANIPFADSFLKRVELLKDIPISKAQKIVSDIPLNEKLTAFLAANKHRCQIVTGNIDVWICKLMEKIGVPYFSSKAEIAGDKLQKVTYVMNKSAFIQNLNSKYIGIGDGTNDLDMISNADIGIAFGAVRTPPKSLLDVAEHVFYNEEMLCEFLRTVSEGDFR